MTTIEDQIKCVRREIGYRERVYPRWVAGGKMTQEQADRQLTLMKDVLATLQEVERQQQLFQP